MTGFSFLRLVRVRNLLLALALLTFAGLSFAQSACTAVWGIVSTGGAAPTRLGFYNSSAGTAQKFTTLTFTLSGGTSANALAGDPATGLLYYFDRAGLTLGSINLNTNATATVGTISPASPNTNANIIGAVIDQNGNLIMMSTSGAAGGNYQVATVSKTGNTTNAVWRTVTYAIGGGLPTSGGSGDLFMDKANQLWLITNSTPSALYPLTLGITAGSPNGTITSSTVGASTTYAGPASIGGVAIDPTTGQSYFSGVTGGSITFAFTPGTANTQVLVDSSPATLYTLTDMGSCVLAPAAPSISKTFSPTYQALSGATTTLIIAISNINTVPIYLTNTFTDTFPAGMTVAAVPALTTGACAASTTVTNVITATAGATTLTFAAGGRVPAGGCTITLSVTAPASTSAYTNTIAAGALGTTAGANATATSATYKVGTDFSAVKSQCVGVCGTTSTSVVTIGGGQTVQYILTITNSASGGTGSVTFTDTLPTLITPVLSITAGMTGGGTCSTATAVVGGATQVTGTLTNALAGAQCTVTITSLVSQSQTVATNVTNTLTLSPVSSTSDTDGTNNTATVPTIIKASANLSVAKTNGVSTLVAGATTSYTITVANIGPAAAPGTVLTDPVATGLACTTVTCAVSAGTASCPSPLTVSALQSTGLSITPTFNANSTLSFVVTCGVTATGQ